MFWVLVERKYWMKVVTGRRRLIHLNNRVYLDSCTPIGIRLLCIKDMLSRGICGWSRTVTWHVGGVAIQPMSNRIWLYGPGLAHVECGFGRYSFSLDMINTYGCLYLAICQFLSALHRCYLSFVVTTSYQTVGALSTKSVGLLLTDSFPRKHYSGTFSL